MRDLAGRVAVVTGAASGIGRGTALAFASAGARLAMADIDVGALAEAAVAVRAAGAPVIEVPTDVSDAGAVERLAAATVAEYGAVHVVCNNAGVWTVGYQWETSAEDWEWVLSVNVMGVVHGIRSFVPRLLAQPEGGHVVNTASVGGLITSALAGPYTASKHAVVGISKGLRAELAALRAPVGVSVVCPGQVATNIVKGLRARGGDAGGRPEVAQIVDRLDAGIATGMSPEEAGRIIVEAVREDRFWVLPNGRQHLPLHAAEHEELTAAWQAST